MALQNYMQPDSIPSLNAGGQVCTADVTPALLLPDDDIDADIFAAHLDTVIEKPSVGVRQALKRIVSKRSVIPAEDFSSALEHTYLAESVVGQAYTSEGYIGDEMLTNDGRYIDEHSLLSIHFIQKEPIEGGKTVVARQIIPRDSITELPTLRKFECNPVVLADTAGLQDPRDILKIDPGKVVEISGLASVNGEARADIGSSKPVVDLYIQMLVHSLEQGHELWVMSIDRRLTPKLRYLLGDDLKPLGESQHYLGSESHPACLSPKSVIESYISGEQGKKRPAIRERLIEALQDFSSSNADPMATKMLRAAGVQDREGRLRGFAQKRKPEVVAGALLTGYALLRAAPLAAVEEFNGSPAVFGAIDVLTVPPYVYGLSEYLRQGNSLRRRAIGAVVASASFVAPYAYLYKEGEDYPAYVNAVVAGFIGLGLAKNVIASRKTLAEQRNLDTSYSHLSAIITNAEG